MASEKSRYWACVVYPESMSDGWEVRLKESCVACAMSPLHDKDVDAEGKPKKSHYHVLVKWGNTTTMSSVLSFAKGVFGSCATCIRVVSPGGYYDYLYHKNDPDKAQYDPTHIVKFGGFVQPKTDPDPEGYVLCEILDCAIEREYTTLFALVKYYQSLEQWDYVSVIAKRYSFLANVIKSGYSY